MTDPKVLHEAAGVIAVAKPAGLATQAPPGIASVEAWLRDRLYAGSTTGYIGVPHRLDRAVSGVLLLASTPRAARQLSRQFERRLVAKTYLAVVAGDAARLAAFTARTHAATERWTDWLEKIPDEPRARLAAAGAPTAREAITLARVLGVLDPAAPGDPPRLHVVLEPLTGRMHQLRLQAAVRGLPILGDVLYGGSVPTDPAAAPDDPRTRPIALHAWRIRFSDPDARTEVVVEAPLPPDWPAGAVSPSA